ncbi:endonuclease/exonuclease/phosphatase family protein [Pseudomonas sp. 7P_10.2_Bac1]|uniref:endonuclease/exonuclease/phosphatase family protein n=1 Tax=Pseudomonas sp. 7P_10.2_Bac1 TaxID=2971614 RepID=UPI0021C7FAFF|nr:endonuclease/exonuclease/phosphatase family protein [Pseudomonas sp. 7P_10.2_Bac1]MCU1729744.1 endonuclease/exonuclease/phosphatase family protein [Pseudomonas sp. 7P_10.2_Bac1]
MSLDIAGNLIDSPAPDAVPDVHRMKVVTVNTHKGFTAFNRRFILPELREAVRETDADLVFLQEVLGEHGKHSSRYDQWPEVSQYEFLADSMWSDFAYGRNAVYPDGHHGNAVLSKYPIKSYRNLDVSITGPERRGLLHCVLQVPGHEQVHAICVHLSLLESHRQLQIVLLNQLLKSLPSADPVIIAGDFNDWKLQGNAALSQRNDLHEVFERHHGKLAKTYPARWPLLRLDRIYLRNAISRNPIILTGKPWSHLSDHLPLMVEVHL